MSDTSLLVTACSIAGIRKSTRVDSSSAVRTNAG